MELQVKNIIFKSIRDNILVGCPEKWISNSTEIYQNLNRLNPSLCEDGDIGKIAFGDPERRMKIRTARFLTRKLHLNSGLLNDVQIRTIQTSIDDILFADRVETYISSKEDIYDNYRNEVGGSSCMTGGCADYVRLYVGNPEVYSQLIMRDGSDSARAMIVKLDSGRFFLDRIYTTAESLKDKMTAYANEHGWFSFDEGIYKYKDQLIVTGLSYRDGEVPYQDTFTDGRISDGLLDLCADNRFYEFTLDSTDGNIDGGDYCCNCGDRISEDDTRWYSEEIYCRCCFDRYAFICARCGGGTSNDNQISIGDNDAYVCPFCAEHHYAFCDECNEYFTTDNVQYVESEERVVCDTCLDQHYRECTDCHEFFSELTELEKGDKVCTDCRENKGVCDGQMETPLEDRLAG